MDEKPLSCEVCGSRLDQQAVPSAMAKELHELRKITPDASYHDPDDLKEIALLSASLDAEIGLRKIAERRAQALARTVMADRTSHDSNDDSSMAAYKLYERWTKP